MAIFPFDVWFVVDGVLVYAIERKKWKDLDDHRRFESQRQRIKDLCANTGTPLHRTAILEEAEWDNPKVQPFQKPNRGGFGARGRGRGGRRFYG